MKAGISQVQLYVEDTKLISNFFVEVLGLEVVSENVFGDYVIFDLASTGANLGIVPKQMMLEMDGAPINLETPSIIFSVEDIEAAIAELKAAGQFVGEVQDRGNMLITNFTDPEQNYYAISQSK